MGTTTQLDVVNNCLATLGETGINQVDEDHPFVGDALRYMRLALSRLQAKQGGWWFNRERLTLTPDAVSGFLYVPEDTINVDAVRSALPVAQRGKRLYDLNRQSYVFDQPVKVWLTRLIPFEDLPQSAADAVDLQTQLSFMKQYDADSTRYQQVTLEFRQVMLDLTAQDIRNEGRNLLHQGSMAYALRGMGNRIGPRIVDNLFITDNP